jgi:hypothetical protein
MWGGCHRARGGYNDALSSGDVRRGLALVHSGIGEVSGTGEVPIAPHDLLA